MAKIKTSELQGAALDWAVAKCESAAPTFRLHQHSKGATVYLSAGLQQNGIRFHPSTYWAQGGPIIEREKIGHKYAGQIGFVAWISKGIGQHRNEYGHYGETPLIAAMRCYVASKLGDSVEVPEELT